MIRMPEDSASASDWVAKLIRSYLTEQPSAADTAEGIQRWWIAPFHGEVPLGTVEQALAQLEGEGTVRKLDHFAAKPVYARGLDFVSSDRLSPNRK